MGYIKAARARPIKNNDFLLYTILFISKLVNLCYNRDMEAKLGQLVSSIKYQVSSNQPGYAKLQVWQAADQLALQIYAITRNFPKDEIFGLTSQLRRAALSVPTNIVEGQALSSKKDFCRFLFIANGSLTETEYLLSVAQQLNYINLEQYQQLLQQQSLTAKLLQGLIKSIR